MTTLIQGIEVPNKGGLVILSNDNSPFISFFDIIESSEKAIKVINTDTNQNAMWLPKSALKHLRSSDYNVHEFSFANWFRKINDGDSIRKAFYLFR